MTNLASLKIEKILVGYNSFENSFEVDNYPYGFTLRTKIRYWIETKKGKGDRFVSCTLNPKTNQWNKPKAGVYCTIIQMYIDYSNDYVEHFSHNEHGDIPKSAAFIEFLVQNNVQLSELQFNHFKNEIAGYYRAQAGYFLRDYNDKEMIKKFIQNEYLRILKAKDLSELIITKFPSPDNKVSGNVSDWSE